MRQLEAVFGRRYDSIRCGDHRSDDRACCGRSDCTGGLLHQLEDNVRNLISFNVIAWVYFAFIFRFAFPAVLMIHLNATTLCIGESDVFV